MNPEITKLIEQYLSNELSSSDKAIFERRMEQDPALQKEVQVQKSIHDAAKRAATRAQVQQIGKSYHIYKNSLTAAVVIAIIVAASLIGYYVFSKTSKSDNFSESTEVKALIEQLKENSPIDNLASEFFYWEGQDSVILSKEGVLLSVPENAFLLNGKPYSDKAIIQWQEAMDGATIVKSGLSTMADDNLLETQGMFGLQGYTKDGKKLTVNPKIGIYVQAPVDQYKEGMQLFAGEKGKDGTINWVNPTPLMKIPVPVDMSKLDFYPTGYEGKLDEMKKNSAKKYRDSLYLSFDVEKINDEIEVLRDFIPAPENSENDTQSEIKKNKATNQESINNQPSPKKRFKHSYASNSPQIEFPEDKVKTRFEIVQNGDFATIICHVSIIDNWHINAINLPKSCFGIPSSLLLNKNVNFNIIGTALEPKPHTYHDNLADEDLAFHSGEFELKQKIKINSKKPFTLIGMFSFQTCNEEKCLPPYGIQFNIKVNGAKNSDHISPPKVIAFWQPTFNNTLLATREFEKRMKSIHKTCDDKVLKLYTSNLSKSINEIDKMAVALGHPEFAEFVKENVGALNPNSPHLKGLQNFYKNAILKLEEEVKYNSKKQQRKNANWDNEVSKTRNREHERTSKREVTNFNQELNYNMQNVKKQLGNTVGFHIYGYGSRQNCNCRYASKYVNVYNIDRIVYNATANRKSVTIIDNETGKIAKISYSPFSFNVKDSKDYDKLFTYMFPSKLNSYQRISEINGQFNYSINNDIAYDLCVIGISIKGYFYKEIKGISKGDLGSFSLTALSEKELDAKINSLNESRGIIKPMDISSELKWLVKEQKNYIEQNKRKEDAQFRDKIKKVIFPCWEGSGEIVADTLINSGTGL